MNLPIVDLTPDAPGEASTEALHAAFEEWADNECLMLAHSISGRVYVSDDTHAAWEAWQEATRQANLSIKE
jgi:hypothetical protein